MPPNIGILKSSPKNQEFLLKPWDGLVRVLAVFILWAYRQSKRWRSICTHLLSSDGRHKNWHAACIHITHMAELWPIIINQLSLVYKAKQLFYLGRLSECFSCEVERWESLSCSTWLSLSDDIPGDWSVMSSLTLLWDVSSTFSAILCFLVASEKDPASTVLEFCWTEEIIIIILSAKHLQLVLVT